MKKIIIVVLALAIVLGFLFWKFAPNFLDKGGGSKEEDQKEVTINISALWEEEKLVKPALDAYTKAHPNVKINYKYQSSTNYRSRIQAQINDPKEDIDVFLINNSWVPMFVKAGQLSGMPKDLMSADEFSKTFYPVEKNDLVYGDNIVGLARGIDGLGMYVNEDILKAGGVQVPQTWDQFIDASRHLTVKVPQSKRIQTAGAALGSTGNVDHWSDILGLLFLQNPGASLEKPNNEAGAEVLQFYTSFVTDPENAVWDPTWEHSTDAFTSGKVAFYFGPSWRASEIKAKNPNLKFRVYPVPQLPGKTVGWANYWAYAVSSKSTKQKQSWELLKYLTSAEVEKQLYNGAVADGNRLLGLPYSRVDLGKELTDDPYAGAFVNQGPNYKSWYLNSNTFDQAINDQMSKYFEDAINSVVQGGDPAQELETVAKGVAQVEGDNGVSSAQPSK